MTSLSEVYKPDAEFQTSLRRLYAGLGLFAVGGLLAIAGVVVGAVTPFDSLTASWEWAGVLAGLGVPAAILGIFAVLPSGGRTRAAAVIGAALSVLGVALFVHAYPCQWVGTNCLEGRTLLTLPVALLYSAGIITTLWCLFTGIVNFESRNSPGGTAHVEVTIQGETKVIEVPTSELPEFSSSMGVLGDTPDVDPPDRPGAGGGSSVASDGGASTDTIDDPGGGAFVDRSEVVDTGPGSHSTGSTTGGSAVDTNDGVDSVGSKPPRRENRESAAGRATAQSTDAASGGSAGDVNGGGSENSPRRDDDWTPTGASPERAESGPDRDSYCGSCRHFEYVRTERGMQPYCGYHEDLMGDMDACDDYTPRK